MAVEIKTAGAKPVRNAFEHLVKRFGDKPASRYQEFAFDNQPKENFHYRPLYDPTHELYDTDLTAIVMEDWYELKDPRQFYYGSYTTTRAKQQDAIDQQMSFIDERNAFDTLPAEAKDKIIMSLVALRHYEWGANTNNGFIAAYGYGTTITQAATMAYCDRLGMAQHLSRIGLFLDGKTGESLETAKQYWTGHPAWQGVRKEVENQFVIKDWFETMVAQNLVADGLMYPFMFEEFDRIFAQQYGNDLSSLCNYSLKWQKDFSRWVDAVIKVAVSESENNAALIQGWVNDWSQRYIAALNTLASELLGEAGSAAVEAATATFAARLGKIGLSLSTSR